MEMAPMVMNFPYSGVLLWEKRLKKEKAMKQVLWTLAYDGQPLISLFSLFLRVIDMNLQLCSCDNENLLTYN